MFENEIKKISDFFNWDNVRKNRNVINNALLKYLGLQGQAQAQQAITDYDNSFVKHDGLGKAETTITFNEDGSATFKSSIEYNIRAGYLAFIPIVANQLPFIEPIVREQDPSLIPEPDPSLVSEPEPEEQEI